MSEDSRIRIVQCLCPDRHCIMAVAFDPRERTDDQAVEYLSGILGRLLAKREIDPWCGLCKSRVWHYEVANTRFATMEEAAPHLADAQRDQIRTAEFLKKEAN